MCQIPASSHLDAPEVPVVDLVRIPHRVCSPSYNKKTVDPRSRKDRDAMVRYRGYERTTLERWWCGRSGRIVGIFVSVCMVGWLIGWCGKQRYNCFACCIFVHTSPRMFHTYLWVLRCSLVRGRGFVVLGQVGGILSYNPDLHVLRLPLPCLWEIRLCGTTKLVTGSL